jgi:hemoglobin
MSLDITNVVKGEAVDFKNPPIEFFEAVGGVEGMTKLMYRFYDHIYESDIAHYFPQDEEEFHKIRVKNTKFFIQICGGPKVYEEVAGGLDLNEFMIRVHDDFSITEKSRVEWLGVIRETMQEMIPHVDKKLQEQFWDYLENFSKLTVNTFSDGSTYYASLLDKSDTRPVH